VSAGLVASLLSIVAVVTAASTGIATHLLGRRAASGRIATSEASVLWQQAQEMRQMLLAEKIQAEEQRDKMIDAYTRQVIPALTSITTLAEDLIILVRRIDANTQPRLRGTPPGPGAS
jgi:hypothetical protein